MCQVIQNFSAQQAMLDQHSNTDCIGGCGHKTNGSMFCLSYSCCHTSDGDKSVEEPLHIECDAFSNYDTPCVGGCGQMTNGSQFCMKFYCINDIDLDVSEDETNNPSTTSSCASKDEENDLEFYCIVCDAMCSIEDIIEDAGDQFEAGQGVCQTCELHAIEFQAGAC